MTRGKCMACGLVWGFLTALFVWCLLLVFANPVRAEVCQPIAAGALIWTTQGYSVSMGEGNVVVPRANIAYHDGPLLLCMPGAGLFRLYMPNDGFLHYVQSAGEIERQAWIHKNRNTCCPHDNCRQVDPGSVRAEAEGYTVDGYSGVIPYRRVHFWPFDEVYACHYAHDSARPLNCLFRPAPEAS